MDLCTLLQLRFCHSSYADPIINLNGWRIFLDDSGFIPAVHNTNLVAKLLAWHPDVPERTFCSLVGYEQDAFEYAKGAMLPALGRCVIDVELIRLSTVDMVTRVEEAINLALDGLVRLLCATFSDVSYQSVRLPVYDVTAGAKCPCCRQPMSAKVLKACGLTNS